VSVGVERHRGRALKARGWRRETTAKVLKDRRSPRQRGRMGTSVRRTHLRARHLEPPRLGERVPGLPHVLVDADHDRPEHLPLARGLHDAARSGGDARDHLRRGADLHEERRGRRVRDPERVVALPLEALALDRDVGLDDLAAVDAEVAVDVPAAGLDREETDAASEREGAEEEGSGGGSLIRLGSRIIHSGRRSTRLVERVAASGRGEGTDRDAPETVRFVRHDSGGHFGVERAARERVARGMQCTSPADAARDASDSTRLVVRLRVDFYDRPFRICRRGRQCSGRGRGRRAR
jgi:hypothetical protein